MWRKCDLHRHSFSDAGRAEDFDPESFIAECLEDGLSVVALTDHDALDNIERLLGADPGGKGLDVIAGVEVSTDRGHILVLAPGATGLECLTEFCARLGVGVEAQVPFPNLIRVSRSRRAGGGLFSDAVVLIGAHVDQPGSLLGPQQATAVDEQVRQAQQLHGLEVVNAQKTREWRAGVKGTQAQRGLIQGSDAHQGVAYQARATWLFLPELTSEWLRHALACPEASIHLAQAEPEMPNYWISAVEFEGGMYDGRRVAFSPRSNALIGPPSSGKSLIIDAIRFALGLECLIDDVRETAERRLSKCLPPGALVRVEIARADGSTTVVERSAGGWDWVNPQIPVIVFGQNELSRRAMELQPSTVLLDLHCREAPSDKSRLDALGAAIAIEFLAATELARNAGVLRARVTNEVDGLETTRATFQGLIGDKSTASTLANISAVERWRSTILQRSTEWRAALPLPSMPAIPEAPALEAAPQDLADALPREAILATFTTFRADLQAAADRVVASVGGVLESSKAKIDGARHAVEEQIGDGTELTEELREDVEIYRSRLTVLEESEQELRRLEREIQTAVNKMESLIDESFAVRNHLRGVRTGACFAVSRSMPSFDVTLVPGAVADRLEGSLLRLKVGTYIRDETIPELARTLDRKQLARGALGRLALPDRAVGADDVSRLAAQAADASRLADLASILGLWPSDGIHLSRVVGDQRQPYRDLTEGLKALAIKELSFAQSGVPIVSDQPEDAVPTSAVFDSLVPTIRSQRTARQFILASHDANVVVAGDVECVIVLPGLPHEQPEVGTLFRPAIRRHAIDLLEGGDRAFEVRSRRYAEGQSL